MKPGSAARWVFRIFGVVGVVFLIIGLFVFNSTILLERKGSIAEGRVVEMVLNSDRDGYRPVVEFVDARGERHQFASSFSSNPPRFKAGDKVEVLYRPDAPERARIRDWLTLYLLPSIFAGLGIIFALMWLGYGLYVRAKGKTARWLKAHGRRLNGRLVEVELVQNVKVNNTHPYRLVVEADDPLAGGTRLYKSDYIWDDPTRSVPESGLLVLVDPMRPDRHQVDLSFLPKA